MKKLLFLFPAILMFSLAFGQPDETIRNYISTYKDIAIEEMIRTGVPASITLAQGIHETGAGQSELVKKSNNHFGIKCKNNWTGESVSYDDDAKGECFRKYDDPISSYKDHSDFLKNRTHYAFLFKLDPTDYKAWAYGLKKAGYATNPKYPQLLIKLIEKYNLEEYTLIAMGQQNTINEVAVKKEDAEQNQTSPIQEKVYPSGVFKINDTKVLWITKGTAYLKIAEENNLSLNRLFEFNDMNALDIAPSNQLIYLQRKRKKGANDYHEVLAGEALYDIAQKEGIRIESLLHYNMLQQGMQPKAGEKLYLKETAPAMPKLATGNTTTQ